MRIVLLSGASSIHTIRWANGLCEAGHEVHVISQHSVIDSLRPEVKVHLFPFRGMLGYFTMVPPVRKLLREIQPDIVNAHYASGYGTTARLVAHHPWVLSVWGSDVYDFAEKSFLHKWLIQRNLKAADQVTSTSHCMAQQTCRLMPDAMKIEITPFGVDIEAFKDICPVNRVAGKEVVLGTVKAMSPKYGIDTLIRAYALCVGRQKLMGGEAPVLRLRLVGGGEQLQELKSLALEMGVMDSVDFVGRVPHAEVPQELGKLDIYVALSRLESFGVAIIEAGAAGRPVVVSDAGGLPEVTLEGKTGFVVPRDNPAAAADVMEKLILDSALRHEMGLAGRKHVAECYPWGMCIETMVHVYEKTIQQSKGLV